MVVIRIEQMGKCEAFGTEPESQKLVSVVSSSSSCCYRRMCKMLLRESVPRKADKKSGSLRRREGSGALKEYIGIWSSQGEKRTFFLHSLVT